MNKTINFSEFVVVLVIAVSAGFGFSVGMSLFEMFCSLIWSWAL